MSTDYTSALGSTIFDLEDTVCLKTDVQSALNRNVKYEPYKVIGHRVQGASDTGYQVDLESRVTGKQITTEESDCLSFSASVTSAKNSVSQWTSTP